MTKKRSTHYDATSLAQYGLAANEQPARLTVVPLVAQ